jgi:predicted short-subunit dehydrogenase-like oxidoreductase (DUF2520 family)
VTLPHLPVEGDELLAALGCRAARHGSQLRRDLRRRYGVRARIPRSERYPWTSWPLPHRSGPTPRRSPPGRRRQQEPAISYDAHSVASPDAGPGSVGLVGRGRLGTALARALGEAGVQVDGPAGRGEVPAGEAILLCVPDAEIPSAARTVAGAAPLVGHTSGATPLSALEGAVGAEWFGLHPLQTFPRTGGLSLFEGIGCAIAGSTQRALEAAGALAKRVGMRPFRIEDEGRPAYHAAASIASNFAITLEAAAEEVAGGAGLEPKEARALLAPLVRRSVENWAALGPRQALTGPVARGDESTVEAQRAAVAAVAPELLTLFDALVERTRELAAEEAMA